MRLNYSPAIQINNLFQSYQINRSAANKPGGFPGRTAGYSDPFSCRKGSKPDHQSDEAEDGDYRPQERPDGFGKGEWRFYGFHQDAVGSLR